MANFKFIFLYFKMYTILMNLDDFNSEHRRKSTKVAVEKIYGLILA